MTPAAKAAPITLPTKTVTPRATAATASSVVGPQRPVTVSRAPWEDEG